MRRPSDRPENKISIYVLAGVATAPNFMEEFSGVLAGQLRLAGWDVRHSELLFPYGDWSRKLVPQLAEMRHDLYPLRRSKLAPIGGMLAAEAVKRSYRGGIALLIGHSGGGVAAVHAAELLRFAGTVDRSLLRIAQIGSPKCAVSEQLRDRTIYIRSERDPVSLLGSWGGFERGAYGRPRWNARKHAPSRIVRLPLIGKHADYFRHRPPYVDGQGVSNLQRTLACIWNWLHGTNEAAGTDAEERS